MPNMVVKGINMDIPFHLRQLSHLFAILGSTLPNIRFKRKTLLIGNSLKSNPKLIRNLCQTIQKTFNNASIGTLNNGNKRIIIKGSKRKGKPLLFHKQFNLPQCRFLIHMLQTQNMVNRVLKSIT